MTLETFFKKQKVAVPAHQNETDVHNNPNNEPYEATKMLHSAELEDDTSFSAGERSPSFHSHEPILPLIFEDTEISDSLSNRNGKVNAATSTLPLKRCMGYVPKEITPSVWTSFPFQALPLEKNQNFYFENGRFHSGECYKDHYILSNRDLDSNIHCQHLIYSTRLKHLVHKRFKFTSTHHDSSVFKS